LGSQIDEIAHEVQIIVNPDSHSQSNETVAQNDDNDDNDTLSSTPSDSFQQSKLMAKLYQGMHSGRSFRDIKGDMHDFENL
jgi:hypothetical protein